ncbi:MAG: Ig-like domain-containing protein, partial [Lachnospiraceae bacterium]|nr:Ig-like domain-containing protein [Lachnospiraceae bacterium]
TGSVTFTTSNEYVASVDKNGRITAKYPGTATIIVTLGATEHHTGDKVYFTVTVTKKVVKVNWTGDTTYTYDGQGHCPQYELVGLVGDETLSIDFSGPVKDAGSYEAKVSIKPYSRNSDKYVLDPDTVKKPFTINPVEVKISAKDIKKTYGDPSFTLDYSVEGVEKDRVSVILNNNWYQNVVSLEKGKVRILNAGTIEIKFSYVGDRNHTAASKTIKLEVAKKDVTIKWNKTSFEYDGQRHAPEATIEGLVSGDNIIVRVTVDNVLYGNPINAENYTARANLTAIYPSSAYTINNYNIVEGATCKFEIYKVATKLEVKAGRGAQTEYTIPLYGQKPTFNPKNYKYIVYYNNGDKVEKDFDKDITVSGFSTADADLGKQTLTAKTTVGDKELTATFTVTVKKQIWITWDAQGIVYNGEKQGPKASVKGLTPLEEYITISYDGVNANQGFSTYTAKAEFTAEGGEKYVFSLYNNTCPYRISPKEVTLSWNYDGAAFVYSEEEN